jgi:hypothetical protein
MKYTILAVSSVFCLSSAFGASINATNLGGVSTDSAVADNAGNPIANVWSGLTTFGGGAAPTDIPGLIASNADIIGNSDLFGAGLGAGAFSNSYNGPGGTGQAIYLILADNSDLNAASLFGLINTGETLDPDGALPDANSYVLAPGAGTAIIGAFGANATVDWSNLTGLSPTGPAFNLEAIPEPSTSLLAGLAGLGLLIRRKR